MVDGRDQGANTPQFVYDAGAEYAMSEPKYPDRKTPMPQDPIFQRYYEKFVAALAEEFNDPEYTSFIDGYGLGKWGEGHSVAYNKDDVSAVDENTETVKREVLDWITKLYAKHFTKVPLVINYHRVLGHPTSQGTANPNSESLVALAISNGYCIRSDAFGMNNSSWGYSTWEKAIAAQWRYKVPIIMEGGYIVSSHSYWTTRRATPGTPRRCPPGRIRLLGRSPRQHDGLPCRPGDRVVVQRCLQPRAALRLRRRLPSLSRPGDRSRPGERRQPCQGRFALAQHGLGLFPEQPAAVELQIQGGLPL